MMPALTVVSSSNGLPMAITQSPIISLSEFPSVAALRLSGASKRTIAKSLSRSVLISDTSNSRPSERRNRTSSALRTTWLLVSMIPEALMMIPEPTLRVSTCPSGSSNPGGSSKGSCSAKSSISAFNLEMIITTDGVADSAALRKARDNAFA